MSAKIIDGKGFAAGLRTRIAAETSRMRAEHGLVPGLAVMLVGNDPASDVYVRSKGNDARECGFRALEFRLPHAAREAEVLERIGVLNEDPTVNGILVQFPVPPQIRQDAILDAIDPAKDVDGLTPTSAGLLVSGRAQLVSCTPLGVMMLIKDVLGDISGADALVIGRSILVGKPMAQLLLAANATVTVAHSRTRDLRALARRADILIAALGRAQCVKGDWIKPDACVIDVGTTRVELGEGRTRLLGDVDFAAAREIAGAITPVPGGVGPMTRACLMRNTLVAAALQAELPVPDV
ncbi:MAG TPA: bifunctional methylenetetrahydrofolate dehydrogenase/methenyltetrahydrofolate cyclohydrolase FolD [Rhizomicrobium sp.]|jgi:methylenetetrahydrofolate dehydrogenase (NADP+)/methenyltetrahydrofolate cyclohydrolase|nr:bifunctional methylenetetrahydrofolate dehydrogenase/methenyltetrahydrofolate cyclohydrolase FolD [Rhizomicrobium sp.]